MVAKKKPRRRDKCVCVFESERVCLYMYTTRVSRRVGGTFGMIDKRVVFAVGPRRPVRFWNVANRFIVRKRATFVGNRAG